MALKSFDEMRSGVVAHAAESILAAAKTAPKGRGIDTISYFIVDGDELENIVKKMKEMAVRDNTPFFARDAENVLQCDAMLLLGTTIQATGLRLCGMCGHPNCAEKEKHPQTPCVFNVLNLGIAIGSAVSVAADRRIDNRIMYSVGQAVMEMGLLGDNINIVHGIPLSASAKSPFFDRKPVQQIK